MSEIAGVLRLALKEHARQHNLIVMFDDNEITPATIEEAKDMICESSMFYQQHGGPYLVDLVASPKSQITLIVCPRDGFTPVVCPNCDRVQRTRHEVE